MTLGAVRRARSSRALVCALLALLLGVGALLPADALAEEPASAREATPEVAARYVPETGFWLDDVFGEYWERNGGLMTFGYPISRVFYQDGLHRQYFERAIFERREDAGPSDWQLTIVRLGALNTVERRQAGEAAFLRQPAEAADPSGRYFPETGHTLSATFRDYWDAHGGLQTFGYPLSEELLEVGSEGDRARPVQYFERARLEWHDELEGTPYEVLLGHLGHEALGARTVPPLALQVQADSDDERDAPPLGPLPAGEPTAVNCGFNFAFWGGEELARNAQYLDLLQMSGCTWLRIQLTWREIEPTRGADVIGRLHAQRWLVRQATERGLQVLVNVTHPPQWARPSDPAVPADPSAFASLMHRLVGAFAGEVDAWQIWNEPNLVDETNGRIDPAGFLPLLRAGSLAVHAADHDALIVFPGLAPNSLMYDDWAMADDWYLEALLQLNNGEAARYFDVLGVHAYSAGNAPDTYWPGNPAETPGWNDAPEFYFRRIERLHTVLVDQGLGETQVWITEFGWPSGNYADTYGYGEWITAEMQADYLVRAFEIMRTEFHWVQNAIIWHLNTAAYGVPGNAFTGFSVTSPEGQPYSAFTAVSAHAAIWRGDGEQSE